MTDSSPIKQALDEANIEVADHEPNKSGELEDDEEKVSHAPTLILSRITWIGDQITKVSQAKNSFSPCLIYVSIWLESKNHKLSLLQLDHLECFINFNP